MSFKVFWILAAIMSRKERTVSPIGGIVLVSSCLSFVLPMTLGSHIRRCFVPGHHVVLLVLGSTLVIGTGRSLEAGYCGAASYRACPTKACRASDEYCTAKVRCKTEYRTMKETVWEPKEFTVYKTDFDTAPV